MPRPADAMHLALLRSVVSTLLHTPEESLASEIPGVARILYTTTPSIFDGALVSPSEEARVLCAKTTTRIAALIGSKSPQARWAGAVLAKCVLESSFEALTAWGEAWCRRLVGLLNVSRWISSVKTARGEDRH